MQTDRQQKQKLSSFFQPVPKRSLSYNDLKRKRLIRSQKSKSKLHPQTSQRMIVRTQKKKPHQHFSIAISSVSQTAQDIKKIERSIHQLKDVFDEIKEKTKTKKYIASKPFYTDRSTNDNRKISFVDKSILGNGKVSVFYESVQMAGNEKQLIKQIISKKKSQRRLLKFDQIRAELKRSKSKSKSKLNLLEDETTAAHSKINNTSSFQKLQKQKSRKQIRVNKFETVKQQPITSQGNPKRSCNTEAVKKYQSTEIAIKEENVLSSKSQYRSRRKLKIEDFKTERKNQRYEKQVPQQGSHSQLKFHRRLRKTNSQLVIRTTDVIYNKSKYTSRIENKSTLIIKPPIGITSVSISGQVSVQRTQQKNKEKEKDQKATPKKQNQSNQNNQEINLPQDQFPVIDLSEISINKEQSFRDSTGNVSILEMLQTNINKSNQQELPFTKQQSFYPKEQVKKPFKKGKKQTPLKSLHKERNFQNTQNMQSMSNILDFVALPTEELKVKINRYSSKIMKKKSEMEKFKKIFPANFFNNNYCS